MLTEQQRSLLRLDLASLHDAMAEGGDGAQEALRRHTRSHGMRTWTCLLDQYAKALSRAAGELSITSLSREFPQAVGWVARPLAEVQQRCLHGLGVDVESYRRFFQAPDQDAFRPPSVGTLPTGFHVGREGGEWQLVAGAPPATSRAVMVAFAGRLMGEEEREVLQFLPPGMLARQVHQEEQAPVALLCVSEDGHPSPSAYRELPAQEVALKDCQQALVLGMCGVEMMPASSRSPMGGVVMASSGESDFLAILERALPSAPSEGWRSSCEAHR